MTHRRARSWMALAAGGDLDPVRSRRLEKHLAACADCREELRTYEGARRLTAALAAKDRMPDWTEAEWRRTISLAVGQTPEERRTGRKPLPGWAWAGAVALLVIAIWGGVTLLKRSPGPGLSAERVQGQDVALPEPILSPKAKPEGPDTGPIAPALRQEGPLLARSTAQLQARPTMPPTSTENAAPSPTQTVMAMTFVSQETGLTVHWTFNDNFTYQEDKK